jgi:HPt (histidine-containing phosphotransfer) domain-containing protein
VAGLGADTARLLPGFGPAPVNVPGQGSGTFGEGFVAAVAKVADQVPPMPAARAIDTAHLSRMTLGERSLEREVLALFDRQADMLLPRIRQGDPAVAAASVHTLKGSALGIGAFKVARAAEAVEQARTLEVRDRAAAHAIDTLAAMLEEAKAEIARLLSA